MEGYDVRLAGIATILRPGLRIGAHAASSASGAVSRSSNRSIGGDSADSPGITASSDGARAAARLYRLNRPIVGLSPRTRTSASRSTPSVVSCFRAIRAGSDSSLIAASSRSMAGVNAARSCSSAVDGRHPFTTRPRWRLPPHCWHRCASEKAPLRTAWRHTLNVRRVDESSLRRLGLNGPGRRRVRSRASAARLTCRHDAASIRAASVYWSRSARSIRTLPPALW